MAELTFDCIEVRPLRFSAAPTLIFRLHIADVDRTAIHAIALRVQIRIEPQRRAYDDRESELLAGLFGEPSRWGQTLKPFQFASESVMVPSFVGACEVELPVRCTYDLEVTAGKYFHSLRDGVVPMALLFSGSVFAKGERGFWVEQVPWRAEAAYRMPVTVWEDMMDLYFPASAWIRLHRETVDALLRYKARHAIPTWDAAMDSLLASVGDGEL